MTMIVRRRNWPPWVAGAIFPMILTWGLAASSHEVIDTGLAQRHAEKVDALSARIDGGGDDKDRAEAAAVLGRLFGEIAGLLSLDRGSHAGQHSLAASLLLDALKDRGLAPALSSITLRYEPELWPFERYLDLDPEGADAAEARYRLLRADFEKTVAPNPFGVEGLDPTGARAQADRAEILYLRYPDFGDAAKQEDIAFMAAVLSWRAHLAASGGDPSGAGGATVLKAFDRFAADYPTSLRLSAIDVMRTRLEIVLDSYGGQAN